MYVNFHFVENKTMKQDKGTFFTSALVAGAITAGIFLYLKIKKNRQASVIYDTLKKELDWKTKTVSRTVPLWFSKTKTKTTYLYNNIEVDGQKYRVFIYDYGYLKIRKYDDAKEYPVFVNVKLNMVNPIVAEVVFPEAQKGTKYRVKNIQKLLNQFFDKNVTIL